MPELQDGDGFFLRSFWILSTERQIGAHSVGPIPWSSIVRFAMLSGLDGDMTRHLVTIVQRIDAAYLGWLSSEHARATRKEENPGPGKRRRRK